ncbi:MAG: PLD nuclease N-terminal domain-containing protein [Microbacterium sp.]|uniref:PLD nuclease N-terminal domain-containing protein n=1 Tax=Microbacterium sp. TaxID=51671 RepID=UPI00261C7023|nr:PLD nuclease N-terminal domain-containing protein [Microbacterium sp.]MCX6502707.1 PLD nuclease N-terminal domain-containing protein [Microbacterium sp.]
MARLLLILALVAVVFWVYSVVDCAVQPPERHRGVSKASWMLIVLLVPVLGGILWLSVGKLTRRAIIARRAPDDDPAFLQSLSTREQDERIRRLEAELADLDAEEKPDADPTDPTADPTAPRRRDGDDELS